MSETHYNAIMLHWHYQQDADLVGDVYVDASSGRCPECTSDRVSWIGTPWTDQHLECDWCGHTSPPFAG